jgi:hypothetical protein
VVDSTPKSNDASGGSAEGGEHSERTDPGVVQGAIPDTGGIAAESPAESTVAEGHVSFNLDDLLALDSFRQRYRTSKRAASPAAVAQDEAIFYEIENLEQAALWTAKLEVLDHSRDIKGRRDYAIRLFCLIAAWLFAVLLTVCATAVTIRIPSWSVFDHVPIVTAFKLSDTVLVTLIGSTTANIIGLLLVVVNYLFPKRDGARSRSQPANPAPSSQQT